MKIPSIIRVSVLACTTTLNLAFLPPMHAQNASSPPANPTDSTENSKAANDSTAEKHDASTGSPSSQANPANSTSDSKVPSDSVAERHDATTGTNPTDAQDKAASKNLTSNSQETSNSREPSNNAPGKDNSSLAKSDKTFIEDAAQGGMTEVQLGQIAQEKASSPDVKQFGARMVTDHSKANEELKTLAQQKGVSVPAALDARHQAMVDHFKTLSGTAFDRAYVHNMVKDHQKDAAEFQKASTSAQDPDVKAFAGKTLGVIQSHLAEVQNIQSKIK